ncbi:MAG: Hpt domain-containing protein [Acidobacteria bacterium]|nr:Hpt domain-containing protein [Acidobacteriota bacterium]
MTFTVASCPVDLQEALGRTGDDRDFFLELLDLFLGDTGDQLGSLRRAVATGDSATVVSVSHAMKGAAANLAAARVREAALAIEKSGREGAVSALDPLIDRLAAEIAVLREYRATL